MTEMKFMLVVYDISNNKRRTKVHNTLLDFGTPVQYSVFECLLEPDFIEEMKHAIMKVIKPKKDRVRFYSLCKSCLAKTEVTSGREVLIALPDAIIVD